MSTRSLVSQNSKGFSLLEVIVAVAILGIGMVVVLQLFSMNLLTVKKSEDYSVALIYARSLMDEAYAIPDPNEAEGSFEKEGYQATRQVSLASEEEGVEIYDIVVTVNWQPRQSLKVYGKRLLYAAETPETKAK